MRKNNNVEEVVAKLRSAGIFSPSHAAEPLIPRDGLVKTDAGRIIEDHAMGKLTATEITLQASEGREFVTIDGKQFDLLKKALAAGITPVFTGTTEESPLVIPGKQFDRLIPTDAYTAINRMFGPDTMSTLLRTSTDTLALQGLNVTLKTLRNDHKRTAHIAPSLIDITAELEHIAKTNDTPVTPKNKAAAELLEKIGDFVAQNGEAAFDNALRTSVIQHNTTRSQTARAKR